MKSDTTDPKVIKEIVDKMALDIEKGALEALETMTVEEFLEVKTDFYKKHDQVKFYPAIEVES